MNGISFDQIFNAFQRAFSDYSVSFEKEEVRSMLKRRGYTPALSFAAFDGDDIVAFTLNGTGQYCGTPTAYDTGTGTIKEYRGLGLAQKIFLHSLPALGEAGISQYLLEVLQDNEKAIAVYRKLGFKTTRELRCFRQARDILLAKAANLRMPDASIASVSIDEIRRASSFCDFTPSWQNSIESISRAGADLTLLGAYTHGILAGYCVCDPPTGDITQLAVSPGCRRKGIGSLLLSEAIARITTANAKVLNIDAADDAMPRFLLSRGFAPAANQFEMIRL